MAVEAPAAPVPTSEKDGTDKARCTLFETRDLSPTQVRFENQNRRFQIQNSAALRAFFIATPAYVRVDNDCVISMPKWAQAKKICQAIDKSQAS